MLNGNYYPDFQKNLNQQRFVFETEKMLGSHQILIGWKLEKFS